MSATAASPQAHATLALFKVECSKDATAKSGAFGCETLKAVKRAPGLEPPEGGVPAPAVQWLDPLILHNVVADASGGRRFLALTAH